jgi:hypothetical protein
MSKLDFRVDHREIRHAFLDRLEALLVRALTGLKWMQVRILLPSQARYNVT